MAESITKTVHTLDQVNPCLNWLDGMICKGLEAGPVAVTLGRPERLRDSIDNAKFHAIIGDVHKQAVISMPGRRVVMADYDIEVAKTLLVMWYANERELNGDPLKKPPRTVICPVTGERIKIRPTTTKWSKDDAAQFVHFLHALGSECGVVWGDPALKEYQQYREAKK